MSDKIRFIHGSHIRTDDPESIELKLFDHTKKHSEKADHINNGTNAYGPGIYAYVMREGNAHKNLQDAVNGYVGHEGEGSIIGFSIYDVDGFTEEPILAANEYPVDEISDENWIVAIEAYMEAKDVAGGLEYDKLINAIDGIRDEWDFEGEWSEQLQNEFETACELYGTCLDVDELRFEDYESPDEWYNAVEENIALSRPTSHIHDEGSSASILNFAKESAINGRLYAGEANLWGVLFYLHDTLAVKESSLGVEMQNDLFQKAIIDSLPEDDVNKLTYAHVNFNAEQEMTENSYCVVFGTHKTQIDVVQQITRPIDEEKYAEFKEGIDEIHNSPSKRALTTEQVESLVKDVENDVYGHSLSDHVTHAATVNRRDPLILKRQFRMYCAEEKTTLWERRPGEAENYKFDVQGPEIEQDLALNVELEQDASALRLR